MPEVIDEMLGGLVATRETMRMQVARVNEIMEKSNNTLLHVESNNVLAPSSTPPGTEHQHKIFSFKPDCALALVKVLENFQQLMLQTENNSIRNHSALDGCLAYRQRVEYLGSSARKLVVLCDTINQLKLNLEAQRPQSENSFVEEEEDEI